MSHLQLELRKPLPHKKYEIKYHQVSPTLQRIDYQLCMCDTWLKKSLTKYHQVSPTFLAIIPYKYVSVCCLYIGLFVSSFMYLFCELAVFATFETPQFVPCNNLINHNDLELTRCLAPVRTVAKGS